MTRTRGFLGGAAGLAAVGLVLFLAPLASATSPPFVAVPSYAPYGGLHYLGHLVTFHTGTGSNALTVAPAFFVASGYDRQSQRSSASGASTYGISAWSGVQNVSFTCPASCTTGSHNVRVLWNLSWSADLRTGCPGTATHPTELAGANVSLLAMVIDQSVSPMVTVGSTALVVYSATLITTGGTSGSNTGPYLLAFPANLTSGHAYTVVSYVLVQTYAHGMTKCGSIAISAISSASHSILKAIRVA